MTLESRSRSNILEICHSARKANSSFFFYTMIVFVVLRSLQRKSHITDITLDVKGQCHIYLKSAIVLVKPTHLFFLFYTMIDFVVLRS